TPVSPTTDPLPSSTRACSAAERMGWEAKVLSRFQVLSDAQWSLIEEISPRPIERRGRLFSDARMMVEAIIYRYRTRTERGGDLPEVFCPWQTAWTWHR